MSVFQYEKLIKDKKYHLFEIYENKVFCKICHQIYKNVKKKQKYISVGGSPISRTSLEIHLRSKQHLRAICCRNMQKRRMLKETSKVKKKKIHL
jgi:hypothetical protein